MQLCDYGCGQEARYQFKNGKWCYSENFRSCPLSRKKNSENEKRKEKPISIETTELCSFGCGQIAKFKLKNGKLYCSDHISKCTIIRKKNSKSQKEKIIPKSTPIETTELCNYGCGQIAKFKLKNEKLCCNDYFSKCPIIRKKYSKRQKGIEKSKSIQIETTELCSFGCGQIAKYKFKNGNLCCSKYINQCSKNRIKLSKGQKGIPIETTELCNYGCRQIAKYKLNNEKLCCSDHYSKCPVNKLTIEKIEDRFPTFYKVEPLRYNPEKPNEKEIQVRCKNHKCPNSKEKNGWFTPTRGQLHIRIYSIEKPNGNDGGFFYCSDECKKCPAFNMNRDPNKEIDEKKLTTDAEDKVFKEEVRRLQREEHNTKINFCEMCGVTTNLHIHHYKPKKTHPGMVLDPPNGIIYCSKCHYEYGHKKGTPCSTGNLANYNPCDE